MTNASFRYLEESSLLDGGSWVFCSWDCLLLQHELTTSSNSETYFLTIPGEAKGFRNDTIWLGPTIIKSS